MSPSSKSFEEEQVDQDRRVDMLGTFLIYSIGVMSGMLFMILAFWWLPIS